MSTTKYTASILIFNWLMVRFCICSLRQAKPALFTCSPKKIEIRIRYALPDPKHPRHGDQLPPMIGTMIDDVQDIFIPRPLIGDPLRLEMQHFVQFLVGVGTIADLHPFGVIEDLVHDLVHHPFIHVPFKTTAVLPGDKQPPEFLRAIDML